MRYWAKNGRLNYSVVISSANFTHTPVHGSWLNMAEIEIGILDKQCLDQRLPTAEKMVAEVNAWQHRRNRQRKTIDWTFTKEKADKKLEKNYVDVA